MAGDPVGLACDEPSGATATQVTTLRVDAAAAPDPQSLHRQWRPLYMVGAVVAVVAVAGSLLDITLTMLPGWGTDTVPDTAAGWLTQLRERPLLGLRNLDLLNAVLAVVVLPMYLGVYLAQRRANPAITLVGVALVGLGAALFVGANASLPMLELARGCDPACTPAQQLALEPAVQALLARGAHGSLGALPGFLVSEIGTALVAVSMLGGGVFGRPTAWVGILAATGLTAYTVAVTLQPDPSGPVLGLAMLGGLAALVWNVLIARVLWARARRNREEHLA